MSRLCLLLAALLPVLPASANDKMIEGYLARRTDEVNKRFLGGAKTLEEWQKSRPRLRQEYLDMLGLWPLPEKTPLKATITGTVDRGDVVIDLLHYQSKPGLYVTGNLYRPKKAEGKLPAVLYVCGHSGRGRDGNKTAFQDHGMWFASNGYICLIIDTLQLGEVAGIHHGTYNQGRWWWQSLGYTPAGVECWNGIRGIDYLVSRPDVDADKIAVTGISGGGASTVWIAAADERVKCAVPVSGMSDLTSYVKNKVINGHCDCMFMVNSYGWEWTTIAALIAPRPMLFANSDNDGIFPMDGNRRIIEKLRQVYKMYDKPELVDDYVSKGGHDYRPDLRIAIFGWINRHIKGDKTPVKDADFKPLPGSKLRVFPEDSDLPKDSLNDQIDESFVRAARVNLPEEGQYERWQKTMLRLLRANTFRDFPARIPAASDPPSDPPEEQSIKKLGQRVWHSIRRRQTEPGIELELKYGGAKIKEAKEGTMGMLLVLRSEEEAREGIPFWAKVFKDEGPVVVIVPRTGWTRKNPPNYVERSHALLGRTIDVGRVWDIAATVRYLSEKDPKIKWKVVGRKEAGVLAAYAALLEPSIEEVIAVEPPASHRDGPTLLNVMRVLDIPEAFGLLAPRSLTLVNAEEALVKRVGQIFVAAGAGKKLRQRNIAFP
jgi:cephalosporin-C deacetylase-like acetyl esterase